MTPATAPVADALRRAGAVAVVQPLPGIGDMIWHLPHLRALAAAAGQPVTLLAKRRSRAGELLAAEPSVGRIIWLPGSRGSVRQAREMARLAAELRHGRFGAVVFLHQSVTLAAIAALAGVPERYGYGYRRQRWFLNRPPFLPAEAWLTHPFEQAGAWLAAAGIAVADAEPVLPVLPEAAGLVRGRIEGRYAVLGIGSSEPYKQWGADNFTALVLRLRAAGLRCVLAGGPAEAGLALTIMEQAGTPAPMPALNWPMGELAAVLAGAAFYVGNDTGAANLAAAVGTQTYCLFGATPPLVHSRRIVAIVPPGGMSRTDGMARIAPDAVMQALAPSL